MSNIARIDLRRLSRAMDGRPEGVLKALIKLGAKGLYRAADIDEIMTKREIC